MRSIFHSEATALAQAATGRQHSLFANAYGAAEPRLRSRLSGARVLVVGGAGSIGAQVTKLLAGCELAALHVLDISENALVELTRDLRSSPGILRARDMRWLPLDFGSGLTERLVAAGDPYDAVLNFAALKHVRSEKDATGVLRMLDVNVLRHAALLAWLGARSRETSYFAVSTDKAANPVNLMGASKRLMEHVILSGRFGSASAATSARFANVAFSEGSLLSGWLQRLAKQQPLAVPRETRRYFVSLEEAGQLCMLAAFCLDDRQILVPRLDPEGHLTLLEDVVSAFLRLHGLEPEFYTDQDAAIAALPRDLQRGRYPVLVTPLDTVGEKPYEEFVGSGEAARDVALEGVQAVAYEPSIDLDRLSTFLDEVSACLANPSVPVSKAWIVEQVSALLADFSHAASDRNLDDRA